MSDRHLLQLFDAAVIALLIAIKSELAWLRKHIRIVRQSDHDPLRSRPQPARGRQQGSEIREWL